MTSSKRGKEEKKIKVVAGDDRTENETSAAADELADCQAKLQEKTEEAAEHYQRMLRMAAELDNIKKRQERERSELLQFANENLIKELLPVVDNLELAIEHGRQLDAPAPMLEGIELVQQGLLKVLGQFGVTPIDSLGKPFDPAFHNAVMQEQAPEAPDSSVIKEFKKGYLMHNRLLRPAMVVVANNTETSVSQTETTVQEER